MTNGKEQKAYGEYRSLLEQVRKDWALIATLVIMWCRLPEHLKASALELAQQRLTNPCADTDGSYTWGQAMAWICSGAPDAHPNDKAMIVVALCRLGGRGGGGSAAGQTRRIVRWAQWSVGQRQTTGYGLGVVWGKPGTLVQSSGVARKTHRIQGLQESNNDQ